MNTSVFAKRLMAALLCALAVLLPFAGYYASWAGNAFGSEVQERVTIAAEYANELAAGQRLQLQVRYGGVPVDARAFLEQAVEKEGWYVSENGVLCTEQLQQPLSFDVSFPNVYEFCFLSYGDSPCVSIRCDHESMMKDLYSGTVFHTQYQMIECGALHPDATISPWLMVGIILAITFLFAVLQGRLRLPVIALMYAFTMTGMIATAVLLRQISLGYAALIAASIVAALVLCSCGELRRSLCTFTHGLPLAGLIVLCGYASFALFGNRLFLQMPVVTITLRTLSLFCLLTVVILPLICLLVAVLAFAPRHAEKQARISRTQRQLRNTRILCLVCMLVPLGTAIVGFYPCATSYDGTLYWNRGVGIEPMGEPFGYCLLLRTLACITTNPVIYAAFQSLVFALAVSGIGRILYGRGVPRWAVCLLSFGAAVLPVNMMYCMLLSTNPMMAILLLYALYFLVRLLDEPEACAKCWTWMLGAFGCCVLMGDMRRNSLPTLAAFLLVIGCVVWKCRKTSVWKRLAALAMCAVLSSQAITTAGDRLVDNKAFEAITSKTVPCFLFKPVASAYANDCVLPQETLEIMERAYGRQWVDMTYDPHDSDLLMHGEHYNLQVEPTSTYVKLFLDTFARYPAVVVKDLLDQSELAWCVFACPLNRNIRYHIGVDRQLPVDAWLPEHPWPQAGEAISNAVVKAADAIASVPLLDSLCYRAGASVILFLALVLVLLKQRRAQQLLPMLPVLGLALTTFPAASFPFYQYFWFFPLTVAFFALLCICPERDGMKE